MTNDAPTEAQIKYIESLYKQLDMEVDAHESPEF